MKTRREITNQVTDVNGNVIEYRYLDGGLLLEDQMILNMKHYLYQLTSGKSAPLETTGKDFKKLKDYWMRYYVSYNGNK